MYYHIGFVPLLESSRQFLLSDPFPDLELFLFDLFVTIGMSEHGFHFLSEMKQKIIIDEKYAFIWKEIFVISFNFSEKKLQAGKL